VIEHVVFHFEQDPIRDLFVRRDAELQKSVLSQVVTFEHWPQAPIDEQAARRVYRVDGMHVIEAHRAFLVRRHFGSHRIWATQRVCIDIECRDESPLVLACAVYEAALMGA
jgi:hypothetical protein